MLFELRQPLANGIARDGPGRARSDQTLFLHALPNFDLVASYLHASAIEYMN